MLCVRPTTLRRFSKDEASRLKQNNNYIRVKISAEFCRELLHTQSNGFNFQSPALVWRKKRIQPSQHVTRAFFSLEILDSNIVLCVQEESAKATEKEPYIISYNGMASVAFENTGCNREQVGCIMPPERGIEFFHICRQFLSPLCSGETKHLQREQVCSHMCYTCAPRDTTAVDSNISTKSTISRSRRNCCRHQRSTYMGRAEVVLN